MAVIVLNSTLIGAVTPFCNECTGTADYNIDYYEYVCEKPFWDRWVCPDCKAKRYK